MELGIISYEIKNTIIQELAKRSYDSSSLFGIVQCIATEDIIIKPGLVKYAFSDINLGDINTQICTVM